MFQNMLWVYGMAWMSVRFPGLKFCPSPPLTDFIFLWRESWFRIISRQTLRFNKRAGWGTWQVRAWCFGKQSRNACESWRPSAGKTHLILSLSLSVHSLVSARSDASFNSLSRSLASLSLSDSFPRLCLPSHLLKTLGKWNSSISHSAPLWCERERQRGGSMKKICQIACSFYQMRADICHRTARTPQSISINTGITLLQTRLRFTMWFLPISAHEICVLESELISKR